MSTLHTPGPWTAQKGASNCDTFGAWGEVACDEYFIASVWADVDSIAERAEANAHLIAAAPDLLAALKYLLELGGDDDRRIAAEAAIAKAEGR